MIEVQIVPGVTMRLTEAEVEVLHLETMGALRLCDEARAQEVFVMVEDEARGGPADDGWFPQQADEM